MDRHIKQFNRSVPFRMGYTKQAVPHHWRGGKPSASEQQNCVQLDIQGYTQSLQDNVSHYANHQRGFLLDD